MLSTDLPNSNIQLSATARHVLAVQEDVFAEWEARVRAKLIGATTVAHPILLNTLPMFYGNLVEALSPAIGRENAASNTSAAAGHGAERARTTEYKTAEVVQEYQILRDCLHEVCASHDISFTSEELTVITRSFDQAICEAVSEFAAIQSAFRERIAASLTHDMRTPLSVIMTAAQLLSKSSDSGVIKIAEKIADQTRRLESMLQEQLDAINAAPVITERLEISYFDALEIAVQVANDSNVSTGAVVRCGVAGKSVYGWWDRDALLRALENLVGNAVKYGSGKQVTIDVSQAHGRLVLSVHNSGNPIDEEQHIGIFRFLNRGETHQQKGWGIGLQFVQDVAIRHSGTIVLDSAAETGTTFSIDIPCDARQLPLHSSLAKLSDKSSLF
ncbi:sensor histidine kinase [Massilia timonae]|jgi:signal transduction histidine kinase|uniref:sensor histidine kinase n=1 Tax=Massilia timonae TaxID=47229 RepID=UPI00289FD637|nr:HAMP domain-containing sensor histidine kinase [Massilia timonae]